MTVKHVVGKIIDILAERGIIASWEANELLKELYKE